MKVRSIAGPHRVWSLFLLSSSLAPRPGSGSMGIVPLVTGIIGFCPLYRVVGMRTFRQIDEHHSIASRFSVRVEQVEGFEFLVKFDKEQFAPLRLDEPPPLGHDVAPNAARILAAAVGNCLSASLVFCLKKSNVRQPGSLPMLTSRS